MATTLNLYDQWRDIIVIQTGAAGLAVGPRSIDLGLRAVAGPWKITTGAGATVIAIGQFSV